MAVHAPNDAVLVVEDEALVRFLAVDSIRNAGFKVYEAADADEAFQLLEMYEDIGCVFTDVSMPGSMDGARLAQRVHDRWPPLELLVTSGKYAKNKCELPEGSIFVEKPYSPQAIVCSLNRMMDAGHHF